MNQPQTLERHHLEQGVSDADPTAAQTISQQKERVMNQLYPLTMSAFDPRNLPALTTFARAREQFGNALKLSPQAASNVAAMGEEGLSEFFRDHGPTLEHMSSEQAGRHISTMLETCGAQYVDLLTRKQEVAHDLPS